MSPFGLEIFAVSVLRTYPAIIWSWYCCADQWSLWVPWGAWPGHWGWQVPLRECWPALWGTSIVCTACSSTVALFMGAITTPTATLQGLSGSSLMTRRYFSAFLPCHEGCEVCAVLQGVNLKHKHEHETLASPQAFFFPELFACTKAAIWPRIFAWQPFVCCNCK